MGNIYAGMSVGLGFILFCILLSVIWIAFRNFKKRMLPEKGSLELIDIIKYQEDERRDGNRIKIVWPVSLETDKGIIRAETRDLSRSGAFVKCSRPFQPGEKFKLTIEVPDKDPLSLSSEVVWSNTGIPEEKIITRGMGIRFLQNFDEDLVSLRSVLEEYLESIRVPVKRAAFI